MVIPPCIAQVKLNLGVIVTFDYRQPLQPAPNLQRAGGLSSKAPGIERRMAIARGPDVRMPDRAELRDYYQPPILTANCR